MKKSIFLFFAAILCAMGVQAKNVYAVNYSLPGNGSNTYCHNWQNTNTHSTTWPGTKMTKLADIKAGSCDIYYCTLKASTNNKVILHDNNGNKAGNGDLTFDSKYPQPTYANGSWWYSPRLTSAIWGDAQNVSGGYVYFDNTQAQWNDTYIYLIVGHDKYLGYYRLTKLEGTNLYYASLKDLTWSDAKFVVMAGHSSSKSTGNASANTITSLTHFSDAISYGLNTGTSYMITMESGANCTPISIDWNNDGYSKYNSSQTIYKVIDNATTSENVGSVSITTTKLSGNCTGTKNNSTVTIADNNDKASTDAVLTATVTLTASANTGYKFLGWAEAADGAIVNTNATLTYTATANKSYYAKYQKIYTVTISNDGNGSTNPSGAQSNITEKDGISISADAAENFAFTSWIIVSGTGTFETQTSTSTKFYPTSDATIKATFHSTITNSLSVVAGANISTVTGSKELITLGNSYEISATPAYGYKFNQWTADPVENAAFDNASSANTQVKVQNGSVTVTAAATEILAALATANSFDAGTPTLAVPTKTATEIGVATTATVTATAAPAGYTFTGWTLENCTSADDLSKKSIEVKSTGTDAAATATAKYEIDKYYVVGSFNGWNTKDDAYKMTYDNGVYKQEVTFVKDVQFKICNGSWAASWSYENLKGIEYKELVKSDDKDQNIKLTKDATFTIIFDLSKHLITFEGLNEKYTYVLMGVNKDWTTGIIMERNPDNPHERMLTCQPIEKANDAIKVAILEEGKDAVYCGEVADHSVSYTLGEHDNIVLEDGVYDFYYKIDENKVWIGSSSCTPTFEISATASAGGSVTGTNTYAYKEIATLTATADEGYHFEKWSNGSTDNPLKITVTEDIEIQAIFAINTYTITATATKGGTVTGAGTYDHGTSVTLTATPDFDYEFVNWTIDGTEVSTANPYTFQATDDVEVVANFKEVSRTTQTLSGKFSTGKYEYAEFATGNLQYKKEGENETWRFAKQQYQVVGEQNINVGDPAFEGWIDMFGWSTNDPGNNFGVNPSMATDFYTGDFNDWGIKIGEGWLTLSHDQWDYLLNKRANFSSLKQVAYVGTVFGIMLFPDNWKYPDGCEVGKTLNHDDADGSEYDFYSYNYTLAQWTKLEAAGAVFLPAAGRRFGGFGNTYNSNGEDTHSTIQVQHSTNGFACYWTSSKHTDGKRVSSLFNLLSIGEDKYKYGILNLGWYGYGNIGHSVRLAKVTSTLVEIGGDDNSDVIEANEGQKVNVQVNRTFKANDGYYTICLPFDLDDASEIGKAYQVTSISNAGAEGFYMVFNEVTELVAGQPYLIEPKDLTNPIFEDVTIVNTTGETVTATGAGINFEMVGVINGGGQTEPGQYWVGDKGYFYNGDGTQTTAKLGLRVLFNITNTEGQRVNVRARVVVGENTTTGLDNITNGENTTIKIIENGQLIIIRNGEKFNAQGIKF